MKEFDYELDYKQLDFTDAETRKLYRIGRGEQGVLLVRPYTDDICAHWRFVDEPTARKSADGRKYYQGTRKVRPQDKDWRTNTKAKSAAIFKEVRDKAAYDSEYQKMRKEWRSAE